MRCAQRRVGDARLVAPRHQRLEEGDDLVAEILAEGLEREAALCLHLGLDRLLALRLGVVEHLIRGTEEGRRDAGGGEAAVGRRWREGAAAAAAVLSLRQTAKFSLTSPLSRDGQ